MKNIRLTSSIAWLILCLSSITASSADLKAVESISGKGFHIIEAAIPATVPHKLNINQYRISVMESDSSFVVLFEDPNAKPGQRGSTAKMSSFEVELSKHGLRVIRSNFVR